MKRCYNIVWLTNTPSFYKVNLADQVARRGVSILMVFLGHDSRSVDAPDLDSCAFDYEFLTRSEIPRAGFFKPFRRLIKLLRHVEFKRLIFSGWMLRVYNITILLRRKHRHAMIVESTSAESITHGFKGLVKRHLVKRVDMMLVSGQPQAHLVGLLGYRGKIVVTGGVGLINGFDKPRSKRNTAPSKPLRCLYIGRLVDEKAPELLIKAFRGTNRSLTIIGDGYMRDELERSAPSNVTFAGFIPNDSLGDVFSCHDVLILPSVSEPWGLVVEEAIFHGLPVVVSNRVGSADDLVVATGAGEVFTSGDVDDLLAALDKVEADYSTYVAKAAAVNFNIRFDHQVEALVSLASS